MDSDRKYVIGIDWGRDSDATGLTVMDINDGKFLIDMKVHHASWEFLFQIIKAIYQEFNAEMVFARENGIGSFCVDSLRGMGLNVCSFLLVPRGW